MANKTWFITGTSRGFGREWTKAALDRGDRVAATARDTSSLDDLRSEHGDALLALTLDVTDREAAYGAVTHAHEHFGGLDIVVNNAGYGHFGMVEEISEQEARAQIETNLFGALWVTQAALPFLREQGSGHIIQVSSIGWHLSRLQVGAGGDQSGTCPGGQGLRDQRHPRRAGWLLDRLERSVVQALRA
jgi:NAD(P)-dependent dehydrogenase (short-subunit alcohol dehydrogenase family)